MLLEYFTAHSSQKKTRTERHPAARQLNASPRVQDPSGSVIGCTFGRRDGAQRKRRRRQAMRLVELTIHWLDYRARSAGRRAKLACRGRG